MRLPLASLLLARALQAGPEYERDIRPILERRCVGCHSATATMGSLNLETLDGLLRGGNNGPILVRGKSAESTLYLSVVGKAPDIGRMPFSNEIMPEPETELIREWIDTGAPAAAPPTPAPTPRRSQIYSVSWRPDGKAIAAGAYGEVRLLAPDGKQELSRLSGHADAVRGLAWSKDGARLAAAGGIPGRQGEVKVWNADGSLLSTISGHSDCIYGVALSPDGQTVATASYDKLIKLWDAATGKEIRTLKDHIDAIYALEFTPDGQRLVSAAADRSIKVWNPATGERLFTLSEPTDGVNSLAVSPDGRRLAAAGQDKTVRVWKLEDKGASLEAAMIAHEDAILKVIWSRDGKLLLTSSADRSLKLFRSSDLTELKMIPRQPDWAFGVEFSPDGARLALGRMDGSIEVLEVKP
jgi:WD40 repeat protein